MTTTVGGSFVFRMQLGRFLEFQAVDQDQAAQTVQVMGGVGYVEAGIFGAEQDVAGVVFGPARFDQLDQVEAKIRLHNVRHFAGLQFQGGAFKRGHHHAPLGVAEVAAVGGRADIF